MYYFSVELVKQNAHHARINNYSNQRAAPIVSPTACHIMDSALCERNSHCRMPKFSNCVLLYNVQQLVNLQSLEEQQLCDDGLLVRHNKCVPT